MVGRAYRCRLLEMDRFGESAEDLKEPDGVKQHSVRGMLTTEVLYTPGQRGEERIVHLRPLSYSSWTPTLLQHTHTHCNLHHDTRYGPTCTLGATQATHGIARGAEAAVAQKLRREHTTVTHNTQSTVYESTVYTVHSTLYARSIISHHGVTCPSSTRPGRGSGISWPLHSESHIGQVRYSTHIPTHDISSLRF